MVQPSAFQSSNSVQVLLRRPPFPRNTKLLVYCTNKKLRRPTRQNRVLITSPRPTAHVASQTLFSVIVYNSLNDSRVVVKPAIEKLCIVQLHLFLHIILLTEETCGTKKMVTVLLTNHLFRAVGFIELLHSAADLWLRHGVLQMSSIRLQIQQMLQRGTVTDCRRNFELLL